MEGVPRIPMMSFPMRRSADTPHFKSRLKTFISSHYNEDPDSYSNEIHELESLRASAVHVSKDYAGCSTLKKYFCQLNFLKSRFPMNEGGSCSVSFSWYDVFSDNVHGWSDVDFEMSCVLYNVGALHSELGALDNRQTADGMKTSCTHFQCAAGAFSHLRHNYQKYFTPDVSPDMLNILNNVCLGQAQECIFEKSLIDNRKSTITAKVALQIVEYYSTALRIIDGMLKDAAQYSDKLIKAVKKWRKLVELKVHYYGCIAYLYRGMQAEDQGKWGERVALYKAAAEKLTECQKLAKNMEKTDPIHDTLHFTLDVVGGKVAIAEKENEFIYHEKVPELEAVMSDVKAVSLVKGIQFKFDDPQVAGPDIFGRLVPMEAHENSSLYSEEKAKILRTYSRKIEEKNEALDKFILPLQLDQLELHDSDKIPQELVDCCAALSVNQDAVKRLSELMAKLSSLFHDVEANLEEIQDHLEDQDKREKEYQEVVGKRPPNNVLHDITKEFQKYQSAQAVAAESNKTLHEAMVMHVSNLNILMKPLPDVMNTIPKFDELEKNEEALERMKKLSGKVGEMRKQREMLESQLRDSIMNDDITKSLVVKKDEDLETVFKEELQKHDKITQLLDQNLLAQENIIRALTEANAEYAETRKATVDMKRKRDAAIQGLISSYEAYDELTSKCNKGIEFYTKLSSNVEKLLQRTRSVCKVQNEERDINMERIIRKAQIPPSGVGVGVPPPTSYGNNMLMNNVNVPAVAVPPGGFPSYPPKTQNVPPPGSGSGGYPSSSPSPPVSFPKPSSGGHLKLKDYLAMKKEGLQTPPVAPAPAAAAPPPEQSYGVQAPYNTNMNTTGMPPGGSYNPNAYFPAPVAQYPTPASGAPQTPQPQHQPQQQQQQQQQPPPSSTPMSGPAVPPPNQSAPSANSMQSPYYSAVYHPTANTATNATYTPGAHMVIPTPVQQQSMIPPQPPTSASNPYSAPQQPQPQHQQPSNSVAYPPQQQLPPTQHHSPAPSAFAPVQPRQHQQAQQQHQLPPSNTVPYSAPYPQHQVPPPTSAYSAPPQQQQHQQPTAPPMNSYSNPQQPQQNNQQSFQAPPVSSYHPATPHPHPGQQQQQPPPSSIPAPQPHPGQGQVQQPGQQRPSSSFDEVDYSQTSFLAQYVRQNQGYLSAKSSQQPTSMGSFPSSVNYNSNIYSQDPSNPIGYSLAYSAGATPTAPQPYTHTQNGHSQPAQSQYPGAYPPQSQQQQQQPQSSQMWPQQQQQQPPQSQQYPVSQNQAQYPQQQYQQQYPQQPQASQNNAYYNVNASQPQPQQQQQSYPPQNQQPAPSSYQNHQQPNQMPYQPQQQQQPQPQQTPQKNAAGSNLDLLSDIDFNVMPAIQPLVPSPAHSASTASQNQVPYSNDQHQQSAMKT